MRHLLSLITLSVCHAQPSADFYVATNGQDRWSGRLPAPTADLSDGPFATLEGARDAVRKLKSAAPGCNILVLVRGGTYRLVRTLTFGLRDSGHGGQTITYAAYPGEQPEISSGCAVARWRKVQAPPSELPKVAHDRIWSADVSHIRGLREEARSQTVSRIPSDWGWRFFTLFEGDRRLPRAQGDAFGLLNIRSELSPRQMRFPAGAMRKWSLLRDAEIVVIPACCWTMDILPIEWVDEEKRIASAAFPATYELRESMSHPEQAWVENVFEVLDRPGEWVLDSRTATLYLWPPEPKPSADVVAPVLAELIRVEGRIDYDGPSDEPVRNLRFRGLTFTHGARVPWHGQTGWGVQHDWELFDSPTALVRFRGAENCAVEDCRFVNSGHTALRWDLHCVGNRMVGNVIEHVGGCGILLCGYGPGTKDVNRRNLIANNYIHHIGETYWHSPAIFAWQSGENRIVHNHIHNTPYSGIVVSCRAVRVRDTISECTRTIRWKEVGEEYQPMKWPERERFMHGRRNVIERNDIHAVMETLGDGNCIYISGTGGGNVVRENYCHDVWGRGTDAAVRTDNDQHETLIERNLVTRIHGHACGICNKGGNRVIQNIVTDLRPTSSPLAHLVLTNYVPAPSVIKGNVFHSSRRGQVPVQEFGRHPGLSISETGGNIYHCTVDPKWAEAYLTTERAAGRETGSQTGDPMFVAPERDDFRFRPTSPALAMGIRQPVAIAETGLESPYRQRFIGRLLRTVIHPPSGRFRRPVQITMGTNADDAEIRYTLDGSSPTRDSKLYTDPFMLADPGVLRAKSFAAGGTDVYEARSIFSPPHPPIADDFESTAVGCRARNARSWEEHPKRKIRVTDENPASGKHCLRFDDGPGQRHAFNPHLHYAAEHASGTVRLSFDIRVDQRARVNIQWRQYSASPFAIGPDIHIGPAGRLAAGRKTLCQLPLARWVHIDVTGSLGGDTDGTYHLSVTHPGQERTQRFDNLPYRNRFRTLEWVGFIASGIETAAFFIDNVALTVIR